jgi:hypothetical protein
MPNGSGLAFLAIIAATPNRVEVNATATAASPIVMTEEERLELIKRQKDAEDWAMSQLSGHDEAP